ncbi:MAG: hypothetical protein ABW061_24800 [Polyangiaceae bacterium]
MAELVATASAPLTTSLRWTVSDPPRNGMTTLTASTTLGTATFRVIGVEPDGPCADRVLIPATVHIATSDGGLTATLQGVVERRRDDAVWHLRVKADLLSAEGNLSLRVDETRRHSGELQLTVNGLPAERSGYLKTELRYLPLGSTSVGPIGDSTESPGVEQMLLVLGGFPADAG